MSMTPVRAVVASSKPKPPEAKLTPVARSWSVGDGLRGVFFPTTGIRAVVKIKKKVKMMSGIKFENIEQFDEKKIASRISLSCGSSPCEFEIDDLVKKDSRMAAPDESGPTGDDDPQPLLRQRRRDAADLEMRRSRKRNVIIARGIKSATEGGGMGES
ncbi:hypothetical protein L484_007882 [Morus notabilis]|uniref:Uncharacterized protein n=1 Tax=Morus notabilis TaxID=981085 RepID=W9QGB9_9ROSA|nr:hypothetical protein L484_007882 [Morus notabilis]